MATRSPRATPKPPGSRPTATLTRTESIPHSVPKREVTTSLAGRGPIPRAWVTKVLALVAEQGRIGKQRRPDHFSNGEAVVNLQGVAAAEEIRDKGAQRLGKLLGRSDGLVARRARLQAEQLHLSSRPVVANHGELVTAKEATKRMVTVATTVTKETDEGKLKHRRVPHWLVVVAPFALVVDAIVFTYFTSEIFNVNWHDLSKSVVSLLTSIAFALLGTVAIAVSLHFFGRDLKAYKDTCGHFALPTGHERRIPLAFLCLALLVAVGSGVVMAYRIEMDSVNAGNGYVAGTILGVFFALVVVALNVVIFSVNYRDGSTQTDELDHHSRRLRPIRRRDVKLQKRIDRLTPKLAVLRGKGERIYEATLAKMNGPLTGASQLVLTARSYHLECGAEVELVGHEGEPQFGALLPAVTVDTSVLDELVKRMKKNESMADGVEQAEEPSADPTVPLPATSNGQQATEVRA